ncbi:ribonuclease III domain-containing protein [Mycena metata]|uniref:Ribonuclease III domain-containing protein n=1 Tax=Mycena metata TaxID=1033252 RepID=A0AAD7KI01_9AGAR|nr:ribonuclease III domain-containing protein [Mycena metata]
MALKRSHSDSTDVPLPKLSGDTLLEVFTHPSLRRNDQEPFDNERLSLLGEKVFEMVLTQAFFDQRPLLSVSEITTRRSQFLSDNVPLLVRAYGLLAHLRCHPDKLPMLETPEEICSILHAYIGGIYIDLGDDPLQELVKSWTNNLLDSTEVPSPKKIKIELANSEPTQTPALSNPLSPAQPNLPFLPLFNQTASQRGVTTEYTENFNQGQWTVECVVDGISEGLGTDANKKSAKEKAARQAYDTMGWV